MLNYSLSAGGASNDNQSLFHHQMQACGSFPRKILRIITNSDYAHLITWTESGDAFVVKDIQAFTTQVLQPFFKHNKFSSFTRQLNVYGFKRRTLPITQIRVQGSSGPSIEMCHISHPLFIRDRPDLMNQIQKKETTSGNNSQASRSQAAPIPNPIIRPEDALRQDAPSSSWSVENWEKYKDASHVAYSMASTGGLLPNPFTAPKDRLSISAITLPDPSEASDTDDSVSGEVARDRSLRQLEMDYDHLSTNLEAIHNFIHQSLMKDLSTLKEIIERREHLIFALINLTLQNDFTARQHLRPASDLLKHEQAMHSKSEEEVFHQLSSVIPDAQGHFEES